MAFGDRINVRRRLAAMVAVPMVFLVFYCLADARDSLRAYRESRAARDLAGVCVKVGAAVHELQKERGATAGYLSSGGKRFKDEMAAARGRSDQAIADLRGNPRGLDLSAQAPGVLAKVKAAEAALGAQEVSRNVQGVVLGVRSIAARIQDLAGRTTGMAQSSDSASASVAGVARSVEIVHTATRETSRGVGEIRVAVSSLAQLAETLRASVQRFRL